METEMFTINCDAEPFLLADWRVYEEDQLPNRVCGQLQWDPTRIRLHLSKKQTDGKVIEGNELREELKDQLVMNANVLDHLLKHPDLIPGEWKDKVVFFWGTIYRDSDGWLAVRCLYWNGSEAYGNYIYLEVGFHKGNPAAVLAA